jgi:hypothetical protein
MANAEMPDDDPRSLSDLQDENVRLTAELKEAIQKMEAYLKVAGRSVLKKFKGFEEASENALWEDSQLETEAGTVINVQSATSDVADEDSAFSLRLRR